MVEKTVKQIIEENKGKEIYLLDEAGIWGELPLTENNLQHTPNAVEINDHVVRIYIQVETKISQEGVKGNGKIYMQQDKG